MRGKLDRRRAGRGAGKKSPSKQEVEEANKRQEELEAGAGFNAMDPQVMCDEAELERHIGSIFCLVFPMLPWMLRTSSSPSEEPGVNFPISFIGNTKFMLSPSSLASPPKQIAGQTGRRGRQVRGWEAFQKSLFCCCCCTFVTSSKRGET